MIYIIVDEKNNEIARKESDEYIAGYTTQKDGTKLKLFNDIRCTTEIKAKEAAQKAEESKTKIITSANRQLPVIHAKQPIKSRATVRFVSDKRVGILDILHAVDRSSIGTLNGVFTLKNAKVSHDFGLKHMNAGASYKLVTIDEVNSTIRLWFDDKTECTDDVINSDNDITIENCVL